MKAIRLGTKIISTLVRDRMYYPSKLIVDTASIVARFGVLVILYNYVFKLNGGTVNGITFNSIAWSMFFYFTFSILRIRDLSRSIMTDVQSGNVEVLFPKPINYLVYKMWWQLGLGLYPFLVISTIGTVLMVTIIGIPDLFLTSYFIPSFILVLIFGVLLSLLLYGLVGVLAFWVEDINPLYWIIDKTVMVLGGSYLPIALFPHYLYKIAVYSPFGASQFITHTATSTWGVEWVFKLGIQVFWILFFMTALVILFERASKKVSVNGG